MERTLQILCLIGTISLGACLECYACRNQDSNRDKCIKTVIQCREGEDTCRTIVGWQVPIYWAPHNERVYNVSKFCDTRSGCAAKAKASAYNCKRDWYNDWQCTECCAGELCNFYVTMGSASLYAGILTLVVSAAVAIVSTSLNIT